MSFKEIYKADKNILEKKSREDKELNSANFEFQRSKNLIVQMEKNLKRLKDLNQKETAKIKEIEKNIIERDKSSNGKKGLDLAKAGIMQWWDNNLENDKKTLENNIVNRNNKIKELENKIKTEKQNSLELEKRYNKEKQDVTKITEEAKKSHKRNVEAENYSKLLEEAGEEINRLTKIREKNSKEIKRLKTLVDKNAEIVIKSNLDDLKENLRIYKEKNKEAISLEDKNVLDTISRNENKIKFQERKVNNARNDLAKYNKERNNLIYKNNDILKIINDLRKHNNYQNLAKSLESAKKLA